LKAAGSFVGADPVEAVAPKENAGFATAGAAASPEVTLLVLACGALPKPPNVGAAVATEVSFFSSGF
jgi:hypothetical protein